MILRAYVYHPALPAYTTNRRSVFGQPREQAWTRLSRSRPTAARLSLTYLDRHRFAARIALRPAQEQPHENRQETQKPHPLRLVSTSSERSPCQRESHGTSRLHAPNPRAVRCRRCRKPAAAVRPKAKKFKT